MGVRRKRRLAGRLVTDTPCRIRPAQPADVPALAALERVLFTDPWSGGDFADGLAAGWTILVAENGAQVIGYVIGRSAVDEGEILNLGVSLPGRRRGVARGLVGELLRWFARAGVRAVFLEVRDSNEAARTLYRSFGFQEVGRRRHYYQRPVEDAVVLRAVISAEKGSA